jgi:hypothetical protein
MPAWVRPSTTGRLVVPVAVRTLKTKNDTIRHEKAPPTPQMAFFYTISDPVDFSRRVKNHQRGKDTEHALGTVGASRRCVEPARRRVRGCAFFM